MRKFALLIILVIIFGGVLFFRDDLLDFYGKLSLQLPKIEKRVAELIPETKQQISTPPPLRTEKKAPESFLTQAGVIQWTNAQREKYGLPPLKESSELNASAAQKTEDMFAEQYFAHYSPSGVGVVNLAKSEGYEFIAIGENLALGNFKNDEELVQGWMDSPGHRENILSARYQEIGVAVGQGMFEGKSVWLAVQHFGLPLSACPRPGEALETAIEANQNQIKELQNNLKALQFEIEIMRPKRGSAYIQKIEEYNNLVAAYNALIDETENLINQYNAQIKLFNECAAGS